MRYYVLYLPTENVNLIKDMGMIPYKLNRLFGYDSYVASYKNGEYGYLENEVKGLKMDYVEKKYNNLSLDGARYLRKNAKKIDVLQIFSVTISSVFYAFTYKHYNPNGKIYLKLDCTYQLIKKILALSKIKYKFLNAFLNKADLISIEQEELYYELVRILKKQSHKMVLIPNGVDYDYLDNQCIDYNYEKKENVILNVARIGTEQKNTEMLLQAFRNVKNVEKSGWKLVLVGDIQPDFYSYIDNYFNENPHLKNVIEFKGPINDRRRLFEEYKKAKIFCLSSRPRFESFGIVYVEAASLGDIIISTDVGIARELVKWENGAIVANEDVNALSMSLEKFIYKDDLKENSLKTYELCKEVFNWDKIISKLNSDLIKLFTK
jgi:L-malate glycosyltransferase